MTSLSRKGRPSRAWNVLPERDVDSKFLALGLHLDKDAGAIICLECKYALQTRGERVSRHLGDKHDIPPTDTSSMLPGIPKHAKRPTKSFKLPDISVSMTLYCLLCILSMSGHSQICYIENVMGAHKTVASSSHHPIDPSGPGVPRFLRKL